MQRLQAAGQPKDCGVLAVRADVEDGIVTAELAAVHCSASMALSYTAGASTDSATKVCRSSLLHCWWQS